ncbi:BON domain-containing protein [Actinoplanes sp. NPDC049316]|uniref:BON domain-containing protein n=1 Tax=Actinoplanes sp. NPDC049316 TaxID=3154727 RepID=UPI00341DBB83
MPRGTRHTARATWRMTGNGRRELAMYYWWYTDWYNGPMYAPRPARGDDRASARRRAGTSMSDRDERILRAVADALFDDPEVTGGHIDLNVQNGVVIIDGDADSEPTRSAVVAAVWRIEGVTDVCNALTVRKRRRR